MLGTYKRIEFHNYAYTAKVVEKRNNGKGGREGTRGVERRGQVEFEGQGTRRCWSRGEAGGGTIKYSKQICRKCEKVFERIVREVKD